MRLSRGFPHRALFPYVFFLLIGCQLRSRATVPSAPTPPSVPEMPTVQSRPMAPTGVPEVSPTPASPVVNTPERRSRAPTGQPTPEKPPPAFQAAAFFGYTYQRPDGNRWVAGRGSLPGVEPVDIPLAGAPRWVVGAPLGDGSLWVAVLDDGRVQAFQTTAVGLEPAAITPQSLPPGMPPLLRVQGNEAALVTAPAATAAQFTHPVVVERTGWLAFIDGNGDLVAWDGGEVARLAVDALPDARLLDDGSGRLLLLTGPTMRYGHGVLGDEVEASSITLIAFFPTPRVIRRIPLPAPNVVEGIAPIWVDLTGDGRREIIVTVSNPDRGAQVTVFSEDGEVLATGPAIGRGFRWRHQLAVAPFGRDGALELADVLTPHLGGVVEFYRWRNDTLQVVAQVPGYTSHVLGSRNLDMAVAGDFDGDGRTELLLPTQSRTALGAIRRTETGAEVAWTIAVGDQVSTNLAAVVLKGGRLAIGVGRADHTLRIWLPREALQR